MKTKTINKIITLKFEQWVKTITDENVRRLVKENTIMTGGAIASLLLNEDVNDFDFYFRNKETTAAVADYYVNQFIKNRETPIPSDDLNEDPQPKDSPGGIDVGLSVKVTEDRVKIVVKSSGIEAEDREDSYKYFELDPNPNRNAGGEFIEKLFDVSSELKKNTKNGEFRPVFLSSNAITLSGDVQVVIRFFGDPDTIHENYDFVHCTNYWTSWEHKVTLRSEALECLLTKELIYVGSKYPIASVCRVRKFLHRGWHITAGQLLKMMMQVSKLNLEDFTVLEEQLTGVDVAYFHEILAKLKDKDPTTIDMSYLSQLIDELF